MYKGFIVFFCILLNLLFVNKSFASDIIVISGSESDVDQYTQNRGVYLGSETNRIIFEDLKQRFTFVHKYIPLVRQAERLALSVPTCVTHRIETIERLKEYYFTFPINLYETHRLYQKSSDAELTETLLDEYGNVKSLVALFQKLPTQRLILIKNANYGSVLQNQIDRLDPARLMLVNGGDLEGRNLLLVERGRAEFVLALPQLVKTRYLNPLNKDKLRSYKLADMPEYAPGHIMCNKSAYNEGVVDAINSSIVKLFQNGSFEKVYAKYLPNDEAARISKEMGFLLESKIQGNLAL